LRPAAHCSRLRRCPPASTVFRSKEEN